MKRTSIFFLITCFTFYTAYSQEDKRLETQIRQYWFVMLTAGNNRNQDSVAAAKIQEGHLANI
ncbi:MAG TPA: hypothetical protein VGI82_09065, partial [Chitinophagaceae bacterium]